MCCGLFSLCFLVCLTAGPIQSRPTTVSRWEAGTSRVKITPTKHLWMSGYASRTHPAEGTLIDLWAKALVLQDPSGRQAVLVTMDLVGIPRGLSRAVCHELQAKYGFPREAIILGVSHTHTGPVVGSNLQPMYFLNEQQQRDVDAYARHLQENLVKLVGQARQNLRPAELAWGNGKGTFAVNRRNNREADVPRLRELGRLNGPVDHDVPVLSVRDMEGHLRAVVFAYACHGTVLDFYQWSGDYPGYAQLAIEKTDPGVTALFLAGCGGDQNPLPRRSVALAEHYGRELAHGVVEVLSAPMSPIGDKLAMTYTEIPLPFAALPTREQLSQQTHDKNRVVARRAQLLLTQIQKDGILSPTYPYPVQAWQLGSGPTLVALGGEVVVDYSLRFKRELGRDRTWVAAYTNDVMAYIPSRRVLHEGGYEGGGAMLYYGLPSPWGDKVEERIVAAVHKCVRQVREAAGVSNPTRSSTP